VELASESRKRPKKLRTKASWVWFGLVVWGIPFFVAMTIVWGFVLLVFTSILHHRLNWRFYLDPRLHVAGLLVFSFAISLLAGCYWGWSMWKFYESKRK
jgi:predicted PurR-regulated permease PerM